MSAIDNETFTKLIREYTPRMYRLALGILHNSTDAEDVVCEAVLKAYEHLSSLRKPERFSSWIMQITANEARKAYGKAKRNVCMEEIEAMLPPSHDESMELWDTVMKLDVIYREVIILFFYEQLPLKEISRILSIAEGTVKSRLSRGKQLLRDML